MITKTNSITHFVHSIYHPDIFIFSVLIIIIDIFSPSGELISLQNLRWSPGRLGRLDVVYYIFMGHCLAFVAITARELSRL
jgi:hypothetical protein